MNYSIAVPRTDETPMTPEQAEDTIDRLIKTVGYGFHLDTEFADYVNTNTGQASFSVAEAKQYQTELDAAIEALESDGQDPHEVAEDLYHQILVSDADRSNGPRR